MKKTLPLLLGMAVIMIGVTRCGLLSGKHGVTGSSTQTHVSFQSVNEMGTPASSTITYTDPTTSDTITIESAKLLIRKLKFHGYEMEADSNGYQHHSEDSVGVKFHDHHGSYSTGPYVLNINVDTTVSTIGIANLPHGTYKMVTFQIHKLTPGEQVSDDSFSPSDSNGTKQYYSVIVKGHYNGTPFVFTSSKTFVVKTQLNPPLTVSDSVNNYNVTIQVNVSNWFTTQSGSIIDPTDPMNGHRIESAIRRSFHAIKDNNEDGQDDDHFENGHGDHGNQGNNGDHGNSGDHGNQNGNNH